MIRNIYELTEMEIDALKEVGNIGAGHAATALSQLSHQKIMIAVPEVGIRKLEGIPPLFGSEENIVAAIYMKLTGDVLGRCLLLFPRESALSLSDILLNKAAGTTTFLGEMECSALKEVGNILTGSFVTALSDFLGITMIPTVPQLAYDMVGPILASLATEYADESDHLFCLQTLFESEFHLDGNFLIIFDDNTLEVVLGKLKDKISLYQK